jgi:hypothetical protein
MQIRTLPVLMLLAACGGGSASLASGADSAPAQAGSLECAQDFLGQRYRHAGGSVSAGYLRFHPHQNTGALRTGTRPDTLVVEIRSTDGALSIVEAPPVAHVQADLRAMFATCSTPAPAAD